MQGTIGEVRMFAGNFAPQSWAFCQGQLLSISQYSALYSILGTTFGGNGQTTFGLPDYRSKTAVGTGTGAGLSNYLLGQMGGHESATLQAANLPAHQHTIGANTAPASAASPAGNVMASVVDGNRNALNLYAPSANAAMAPTGVTGSSSPVPTLPPYAGMNYIICLDGIFPSRN